MLKANSAPVLSKAFSQYPRVVPKPDQEPKLLGHLREALRSRHYSRRTELRHGLFHLTHVDLFKPRTPFPFAGEDRGEGDKKGDNFPIRPPI